MYDFKRQVLSVVKNIPIGKALTYKQVAEAAGFPKAARAVGNLMTKNTDTTIPCHRVVRSDGALGSYNGLRGASKADLLKSEGYEPVIRSLESL